MTGRTIRASLLAGKLAEQLAAVVPGEVEVSVEDSVISLRKRGTPWGMTADLRPVDEEAGSAFIDVDRLAWTLEALLDQLQDEIAETVAEPWPAIVPDPMPESFAELRDDRLIAGYGDPADPALTVLSVVLRDLR